MSVHEGIRTDIPAAAEARMPHTTGDNVYQTFRGRTDDAGIHDSVRQPARYLVFARGGVSGVQGACTMEEMG